jgi:GMP synthase-like glutamine amidotransferase
MGDAPEQAKAATEQALAEQIGWPTFRARVDRVPDADALLVPGSQLMVADAPWATRLGEVVEEAASTGMPVLGICFGHQLIARHFGGRLERWPRTRESLAMVRFDDEGPFAGLGEVELLHTHADCVVDGGTMRVVASGGQGGLQALAHPTLPIWSLQAHPEATAALLSQYPTSWQKAWRTIPPHRLDTPAGSRLLAQFGTLVG